MGPDGCGWRQYRKHSRSSRILYRPHCDSRRTKARDPASHSTSACHTDDSLPPIVTTHAIGTCSEIPIELAKASTLPNP